MEKQPQESFEYPQFPFLETQIPIRDPSIMRDDEHERTFVPWAIGTTRVKVGNKLHEPTDKALSLEEQYGEYIDKLLAIPPQDFELSPSALNMLHQYRARQAESRRKSRLLVLDKKARTQPYGLSQMVEIARSGTASIGEMINIHNAGNATRLVQLGTLWHPYGYDMHFLESMDSELEDAMETLPGLTILDEPGDSRMTFETFPEEAGADGTVGLLHFGATFATYDKDEITKTLLRRSTSYVVALQKIQNTRPDVSERMYRIYEECDKALEDNQGRPKIIAGGETAKNISEIIIEYFAESDDPEGFYPLSTTLFLEDEPKQVQKQPTTKKATLGRTATAGGLSPLGLPQTPQPTTPGNQTGVRLSGSLDLRGLGNR